MAPQDEPSDSASHIHRTPRWRRWARWVVGTAVVLAVVLAAIAYWRLPLAGAALRAALERAGIHDAALTVDALSPSGIRLRDVRLGTDLAIARADISFDLSRLPENPFTRFVVDGVQADTAGITKRWQQLSGVGDGNASPLTIRALLDHATGLPPVAVTNMTLRTAPAGSVLTLTGTAEAGPNGAGAYAARFTLRLSGEVGGKPRAVELDGTAGISMEVAIADIRAKAGDGSMDGAATARADLAPDHTRFEANFRLDLSDAGLLAELSPWLKGAAGKIDIAIRTPKPIAIGRDTPLSRARLVAALERAGTGGARIDVRVADGALRPELAAITTIQGLSADIHLDRLVPLRTSPGQTIRVEQIASGVTFEDIALRFALVDGAAPAVPALSIESFETRFAGGELGIAPTVVDSAAESNSAIITVTNVDLAALLGAAGLDGVSGTGRLNGTIPVTTMKNAVVITGGRLVASGPGTLRLRSDAVKQALAQGGAQVALMLRALENFRYETLTLDVEKEPTGEGRIVLRTRGQNPDVGGGQPFIINLNLTGNVDRLAAVAAQALQLPGAVIRTMLPK